jgi:polyphosphate glucokinase
MNVLSIDVGGTHVKVMVSGQTEERKVVSGRSMTAAGMVAAVQTMIGDWGYDVVSIGYPGPVVHGAPVKEPANLGPGWVGFDFEGSLGHPVKIINDAAMQALGSHEGGRMLFLGLGTGLGSAMVVDGRVEPMELAHLPYKDDQTYEDFVGLRGLKRLGKKRWRREVNAVLQQLSAALQPDYIVLGGGNARLLGELPANTRVGANTNAFIGGFRLWEDGADAPPASIKRMVGERRVVSSLHFLFETAAAEFFVQAMTAVGNKDVFSVALSGGSTPRGLFSLLASDPKWRAEVPWEKTHFFWGDERYVPADHPDSNFKMANDVLLSQVPVPEANVHRVHTEFPSAAEAAADYERELRNFFGLREGEIPRFDLVLLGLGPEGHTASLFPGTRALTETKHLVISNWVGKLDTERITLSAPVLNNAACVMFLVTGDEKAPVLKAIFEGPYEPEQLPAQLISPTHGRLIWLLDPDAARGLSAARD